MRARTRPLNDFCLVIWCSSARGGAGTHAPVAPREGTRPASENSRSPLPPRAGGVSTGKEVGRGTAPGPSIADAPDDRNPASTPPLGGVAEPERGPGRLHGLVDHGQQLAMQGVQVDLVPQPGREPLHGPAGVVAAAVEAAIDPGLDA